MFEIIEKKMQQNTVEAKQTKEQKKKYKLKGK